MTYRKSRTSNKVMQMIKKTAVVKLKSTITEIKILLERFKSRFDQEEERINESVDKSIKFIKSEEEKEKRMKKK